MKKNGMPFKMYVTVWSLLVLCSYGFTQNMMSHDNTMMMGTSKITKGIAVLHPTKGNKVSGWVTFTKEDGGVRVKASLSNLEPGKHGFHIHQYGDCSSDDGTSAGGHFNPALASHGAPTDAIRHEGDMGNITADSTGHAEFDYVDTQLSFDGVNSVIGHAVIVHAKVDDLTTQPTGNAGGRVACGVIGIAKQ